MWLATFLVFAQAPEVTGLHAGESAVVIDAVSIPSKDDKRVFVRPRAIDALTGAPVEGVRVEMWTESAIAPEYAQILLDVGMTGRDGCARVVLSDGVVRADKVRLSKPGYASLEDGASSAYEHEMILYPERQLEGRVLDLEGHPIMGASVRTRCTCAHAIPASETHTDTFGRFRMVDFPPSTPDVELVDMRHEPLYQRYSGDWMKQASFYGQLDIYVARRRPVEVQVVDEKGEPLAGRHIVHVEVPTSEAWTDEQGHCSLLPSTALDWSETNEMLGSPGRAILSEIYIVNGVVARVRPYPSGDSDDSRGRILVHLAGLGEAKPPRVVIAPDKMPFEELEPDKEANVPLGHMRVFVGGAFTGFLQETRDLEISAASQRVEISLRREPRLRIHMGKRTSERLVVQAGDDSVEAPVDGIALPNDMCEQGVPPGVPIAVLWELDDGGLRRVLLPPIDKDTDVDLEAESSILRHGMSETPARSTTMKYVVTDDEGRALPKAEGKVYAAPTSLDFATGDAGAFAWTLQAHTAYQIEFKAEGFTSAYLEGVVPLQAPDQPRRIVLTRRAHLEITGKVTLVDGFLGGADANDGGIVMDVAPGPLSLVLAREGKAPIALDLVLAPGEQRRIAVR